MSSLKQWLEVPGTDPEDARRRKLLNVVLMGVTILTLLTLVSIVSIDILYSQATVSDFYLSFIVGLVSFLLILFINRYYSLSWCQYIQYFQGTYFNQ